jgi:predicted dehydrogenase
MEKIKVAVIGCGSIAKSEHIPAYMANEQCEIAYFCDIIPERAEAMVKQYGTGKAVTDYRDIIGDASVEAVSVCTPNNVHSVISIALLNAGKHVLCEKPAAITYDEALKMQDACRRSGKILNIGVVNRFSEGIRRIKALIDAGELGEVYQVYGSFRSHRAIPGLGGAFTTKSIAGGGVLIDWGVHFLDLIMFCCGDPAPKTVSGHAHSRLGVDMKNYTYLDMWAGPPDTSGTYDVDDFVTAMIRTEGPTVTINGAWAQNIGGSEMFVDFIGDKAGVRLDYFSGSFILYTAKDGALLETVYQFDAGSRFRREIDSFLECVRTGEKLPAHIDTVIITSRIMQAIYDSSEQSREIVL